jgi:hypothetical protein
MNFIGIDSSLTSTAVSVYNTNGYSFFSYFKNYEKPGKWTKILEDFTKITGTFFNKSEDYSKQEILKLVDYTRIVDLIESDLKSVLIKGEVHVAIEGYSYSSDAGRIIDLVTLGTLLRSRLKDMGCEIYIFTPSTLKKETCGLVYGWEYNKKGKITGTRNKIGIAGGLFKKRQMLESLRDSNINSPLCKFAREYCDILVEYSNIPHPIEDLVDSHWCLEVLINKIDRGNFN